MQFSRVITPVENIQVWNATSDGFSFVISFASRSGPGFRGNTGFIASWRPIHQNRSAVEVIGSPFKTFPEAEKACEAVLGHLKERARGYSHANPLRAVIRSGQTRRVVSYLEARGHVERTDDRDLIRPVGA